MADVKGFLKVRRRKPSYRPVCERVKDFKEVASLRTEEHSKEQASRCMDCGTPFCQWACPVANYIPEWNDLLYRGQWKKAYKLLQETNNMPEVTGRVCPAPCEYSCVLGLRDDPVTIREDELAIIEYAFKHGYVKPNPPKKRTGEKVAVIGSGPAGIACADQLNKAGHNVTVFEKDNNIGGILRYGIPDFKLSKRLLERRINILKKEGIKFKTGINVGVDIPISKLKKEFNAVCLTGGSRVARDLTIPGRELQGIHFAMDYLVPSNKKVSKEKISGSKDITAKDKNVVVIGGGDTGADCVGVANRQGANCIVQIEVMPKPPASRNEKFPWPYYPMLLKTSTSHEEGAKRQWSILTKRFVGENGNVKKIECVEIEFIEDKKTGKAQMMEIPGTEFSIDADLVLLAVGFIHPEHKGLLDLLKLKFDQRGNVKTNEIFMTSCKGIFAAGDLRRGQSLIVWAISEGRTAAYHIDTFLMNKKSNLSLI